MTTDETDPWLTETAETPYEAARALAPSGDDVRWIDGLRGLSDDPDPLVGEVPEHCELTVIYEDRPVKQWCIQLSRTAGGWQATLTGSKRV
ncbi:hypothetical protein [Natronomonas sp. EA1]|uniref:hypothetical protein n=1 Tax=Natronomonas sp. EA1 TaxID=3421655 RepID=UPI003EBAB863